MAGVAHFFIIIISACTPPPKVLNTMAEHFSEA